MATKNEARKDKLTLVQIRYMEKRINATRDAAERRIMREYEEAQSTLPKVERRTDAEVAKQLMMLHPTITRQMADKMLNTYHWADFAIKLGVDKEWLENKEGERELKKLFNALTARQRKAIGAIVDVATEATDAIYLGDASQLNTILSKMDKVKF